MARSLTYVIEGDIDVEVFIEEGDFDGDGDTELRYTLTVDESGLENHRYRVRLDGLLNRYPHAIPISARDGKGLPELAAAVSEALSHGFEPDAMHGGFAGRLKEALKMEQPS